MVFVMIEELTDEIVLAAEIIGFPPKIVEVSELGNKKRKIDMSDEKNLQIVNNLT